MIDQHIIHYYLDLCQSLHFGKSAKNCFISAATLTRIIQKLETNLGKPLFIRDNRSVALTQSGITFKQYCETQLETWKQLGQKLQNHKGGISGLVKIYCSVTASQSILSDILDPIKRKHPHLNIALETGPSEKTFQKIRYLEADIGITSLPEQIPQEFITKAIQEVPLKVIVTKGYGIQDIQSQKLPFIYPQSGLTQKYIEQWFESENIAPKIYTEVSGFDGIMSLVRLGYGAGVVPELVLAQNPLRKHIEVLKLSTALQSLKIGLCCKRKTILSEITKVFFS